MKQTLKNNRSKVIKKKLTINNKSKIYNNNKTKIYNNKTKINNNPQNKDVLFNSTACALGFGPVI